MPSDEEALRALRLKVENLTREIEVLKARKSYGLVWEEGLEKDAAVQGLAQGLPYTKIQPDRTVFPEAPVRHSLIKGDNYPALVSLLARHRNSVDVIYIDPPYNTGSRDFIYNDRYVDVSDSYRHSKWLSFMRPRLQLAHTLLAASGVLFVSIDDNEQAHLKLLLDEIFGERNFVTTLVWEKSYVSNNSGNDFTRNHDFILVYRKSSWLPQLLPRSVKADSTYNMDDRDGLGPYSSISLTAAGEKGAQYKIVNPNTGKVFEAPKGSHWRFPEHRFNDLLKQNRILWGKNGAGVPRRKFYLSEAPSGLTPRTILPHAEVGHTDEGAKELKSILGSGAFDYPKPPRLIARLLQIATAKKDALVLDFFAGSGTTAQAVAEMNLADGGTRQCILVTDSGKASEGGVDIADDVTYERLHRVLTGENWADGKDHPSLNQGLDYYHVEELPVIARPVVDYDEDDNPVYGEEVPGTYHSLLADLQREAGMSQKEAARAYASWAQVKDTH